MKKKFYLPISYKLKAVWFENFARKVEQYASMFDIDAATVQQTLDDLKIVNYSVEIIEIFKHELAERVAFKNIVFSEKNITIRPTIPTMPTVPSLPSGIIPVAGVFKRATKLAISIKAHRKYTEAIGKDIGIIGAEQNIDWDTQKPSLKLLPQKDKIIIKFRKGESDGIRLYCRRDNEAEWNLLSVCNYSPYHDKRPNLVAGKAETRKYMARFIINDEEVGEESDSPSIAVNV